MEIFVHHIQYTHTHSTDPHINNKLYTLVSAAAERAGRRKITMTQFQVNHEAPNMFAVHFLIANVYRDSIDSFSASLRVQVCIAYVGILIASLFISSLYKMHHIYKTIFSKFQFISLVNQTKEWVNRECDASKSEALIYKTCIKS